MSGNLRAVVEVDDQFLDVGIERTILFPPHFKASTIKSLVSLDCPKTIVSRPLTTAKMPKGTRCVAACKS